MDTQAIESIVSASQPGDWTETHAPGVKVKTVWREAEGPSIELVRVSRGSGIPTAHTHTHHQFICCLSGRYSFPSKGSVLGPGDFYHNPPGHSHGPTTALEDTTLLEIYLPAASPVVGSGSSSGQPGTDQGAEGGWPPEPPPDVDEEK